MILNLPIEYVPHANRVLIPIRVPNEMREKMLSLSRAAKRSGTKASMNDIVYTAVSMYLREFTEPDPKRS